MVAVSHKDMCCATRVVSCKHTCVGYLSGTIGVFDQGVEKMEESKGSKSKTRACRKVELVERSS